MSLNNYMSLNNFLASRGNFGYEGNCEQVPEQMKDLIKLTNKPNLKVMEIGFNAGHSADLFLKNNSSLNLTSFDLNRGDGHVLVSKEYIDITYPNRHTLIIGDSKITIPEFINENKDTKFDIIFIDGGHEYETAKTDMENCFFLAHKDTIVMLDDTVFTSGWEASWSVGPTRTWTEHLQENKIIELNRRDYCCGRGMSWGKYVF